MQRFDILDKMPVSLFSKPNFTMENGLIKVEGDFIHYTVGNKLELDTLYYRYPKNFIVLDIDGFRGCVIKDGIVKGVVDVDVDNEGNLEENIISWDDYIADCEKIYTPQGDELKIDYLSDVYDFKDDFINSKIECDNLLNEKNNILFEIQRNIDTDDFVFIRLKPEMDKVDVKIKEVQDNFQKKWFFKDEDKENIQMFGLYLASLISKMNDFHFIEEMAELAQAKKEISADKIERYNSIKIDTFTMEFDFLKDKFSEFLFRHRGLNVIYLEWLDLNNANLSKEYIEIVNQVILNIYDILEN